MSVLDGEISAFVGDALLAADVPYAVVLTRSVATGGPSYSPVLTKTDHAALGWRGQYSEADRGDLIRRDDVRVMVLASSLDIEPRPGDLITAKGKTYSVVSAALDPTGALWDVRGRG